MAKASKPYSFTVMKPFLFCLFSLIVAQPVTAATLDESRMAGFVTGEVMCVLARHGAPKEIMREEFARLTQQFTKADVLDLKAHGETYVGVVDQMVKSCPPRGLPDA